MTKVRKSLVAICALVCAVVCAFSLMACDGDDEGGGKGGVKNYTMEAEYINLDGINGAGMSSEASGVAMIYGDGTQAEKDKGWSSGYFVGQTYVADLQLDFVFESDKDATATVIVRLGSELVNDVTYDPNSFAVKVNGTALTYSNIFIKSSLITDMEFTDKTISTTVSLKKGTNTISLVVLDNDLRSGQVAGPMIDCIKIKTDAALTFTEKTDNPGRRGEI